MKREDVAVVVEKHMSALSHRIQNSRTTTGYKDKPFAGSGRSISYCCDMWFRQKHLVGIRFVEFSDYNEINQIYFVFYMPEQSQSMLRAKFIVESLNELNHFLTEILEKYFKMYESFMFCEQISSANKLSDNFVRTCIRKDNLDSILLNINEHESNS